MRCIVVVRGGQVVDGAFRGRLWRGHLARARSVSSRQRHLGATATDRRSVSGHR